MIHFFGPEIRQTWILPQLQSLTCPWPVRFPGLMRGCWEWFPGAVDRLSSCLVFYLQPKAA